MYITHLHSTCTKVGSEAQWRIKCSWTPRLTRPLQLCQPCSRHLSCPWGLGGRPCAFPAPPSVSPRGSLVRPDYGQQTNPNQTLPPLVHSQLHTRWVPLLHRTQSDRAIFCCARGARSVDALRCCRLLVPLRADLALLARTAHASSARLMPRSTRLTYSSYNHIHGTVEPVRRGMRRMRCLGTQHTCTRRRLQTGAA